MQFEVFSNDPCDEEGNRYDDNPSEIKRMTTVKRKRPKRTSEAIKNRPTRKKANVNNSGEIGSPFTGQVSEIFVKVKDPVIKGDKLIVIEAMKMESAIHAEHNGIIKHLEVKTGENVEAKDLLLIIE